MTVDLYLVESYSHKDVATAIKDKTELIKFRSKCTKAKFLFEPLILTFSIYSMLTTVIFFFSFFFLQICQGLTPRMVFA